MNAEHCKIIMLYGSPFDKALLSEVEGLRANGINQRLLMYIVTGAKYNTPVIKTMYRRAAAG